MKRYKKVSSVFVLDACALLAVVRNEEGADYVVEAYKKAADGEAMLIINRINLLKDMMLRCFIQLRFMFIPSDIYGRRCNTRYDRKL